jgi:hypothetical protein
LKNPSTPITMEMASWLSYSEASQICLVYVELMAISRHSDARKPVADVMKSVMWVDSASGHQQHLTCRGYKIRGSISYNGSAILQTVRLPKRCHDRCTFVLHPCSAPWFCTLVLHPGCASWLCILVVPPGRAPCDLKLSSHSRFATFRIVRLPRC